MTPVHTEPLTIDHVFTANVATDFFKALADLTRVKLILLLREQQSQCVCDLTEALSQPQPTVSRHLNHLKKAGLVVSERRGTWMWYGLNPDMPPWASQIIDALDCE